MPRLLLLALWVLPAAFAARALLAWADLPAEMASHFSGGQPDSYLPKGIVLAIGLAAIVFAAAHTTFRALPPFGTAVSAGVTTLLFVAFWQVIDFNLGGGAVSIPYAAVPAMIVAAVVGGLSMRTRPSDGRGTSNPR